MESEDYCVGQVVLRTRMSATSCQQPAGIALLSVVVIDRNVNA